MDECICIQDESRGWKDCPEHGHKYRAAMKDISDNVLGSPIFNKAIVEAECKARLEKAGFILEEFRWDSDFSLSMKVRPNISHIEVKFVTDTKPAVPQQKPKLPKCKGWGYPTCCSHHADVYYNTPG